MKKSACRRRTEGGRSFDFIQVNQSFGTQEVPDYVSFRIDAGEGGENKEMTCARMMLSVQCTYE
ncbi:MAG: hypothetical protein MUC65_05225 [Pontiellaceae bacterium]|nr:hypothetical protein [Pontiellaceae bacterium]